MKSIVKPDEYPDAEKQMEALLAGRPAPLYERSVIRKDGTEMLGEIVVADGSGIADGGVGMVGVDSGILDIEIPADLLEEIARVYGYDRIPTTLLSGELPPQRANVELEVEEKLRDLLRQVPDIDRAL